ncbi:UNVERIFIED_CONTAM: S-layer family protein [Acetivibrio alkalicellulosi]
MKTSNHKKVKCHCSYRNLSNCQYGCVGDTKKRIIATVLPRYLSSDHWGLDSIIAVTKAGLFKGYKGGTFKPDANITRAELSAVIANYLEIENIRPLEINYHDIEGHWAFGIIQELHRHNIIKGYEDGSFRPDNNIKRSEAVVLINKMLYRGPLKTDKKIFMDVDKNHWAFGHIAEAAIDHESILDDDGNEILKEGE